MPISRKSAERTIDAMNGILVHMGRKRRLRLVRADNELSVAILDSETNRVIRVASLTETTHALASIDQVIREVLGKLTE